MQHSHLPTIKGQLIRILLENLVLESGLLEGEPIEIDAEYTIWTSENTWTGNTLKSMSMP